MEGVDLRPGTGGEPNVGSLSDLNVAKDPEQRFVLHAEAVKRALDLGLLSTRLRLLGRNGQHVAEAERRQDSGVESSRTLSVRNADVQMVDGGDLEVVHRKASC